MYVLYVCNIIVVYPELALRSSLLALLLDALLLVASGVQVEGEVTPVVARRKGDGLAQREAHGIDHALTARLGRAHADAGGPGGGAQDVRRWRELHVLPVLHDPLPDDVLEIDRDLQPGQILQVVVLNLVDVGQALSCKVVQAG